MLKTYSYKLLKEFEEAVREHAYRGSYHPATCAEVEEEYERAKRLLKRRIEKLEHENDVLKFGSK